LIILGYYAHHSKRSQIIMWETLKIFKKNSYLIENKSKNWTLTWVSFKLPCLWKKSVKQNRSLIYSQCLFWWFEVPLPYKPFSTCTHAPFVVTIFSYMFSRLVKRFQRDSIWYVAHRLELQVPTLVSKIWTSFKFEY
jgi:hypothetical protein